jgi:hypothetical protein
MNIPPSLCLQCRGSRLLCGLRYCPILNNTNRVISIDTDRLEGYTPPAVFVGRVGYPNVSIGPMIPYPSTLGYHDISIYDRPEEWYNMDINDILRFRLTLVRGKMKVSVYTTDSRVDLLRELSIASKPVDTEMRISRLNDSISINEVVPPFGPSAEVEYLKVSNVKVDPRIEKYYYDDMSAYDAVVELYKDKVSVSSIARALSVGCLGLKHRRRLVPTRWSITAVDDTVSRYLIGSIKHMPSIDEYLVYTRKVYMNDFVCIMLPGSWEFEWIEGWHEHTLWNPTTQGKEIMGDHERYRGMDHYARVGGCYYSARLAASEHLSYMKRQCRVIILREVHTGFDVPIGVWFVREQLRAMFRSEPSRFSSIDDAITYAMSNLTIPLSEWSRYSVILRSLRKGSSIEDYFT